MTSIDKDIDKLLRALGITAGDEFDLTVFKSVKGVGPSALIQVAGVLKEKGVVMVIRWRPAFKTREAWERFLSFYGITYTRQNISNENQALGAFQKLKKFRDKR